MEASLQRTILKSTFGSAGGDGGQRDVEDREVEDGEEGNAGRDLCVRTPKDRAAPKVASVYFSPSLAGINIADAVSAVRSSPRQAASRQEVVLLLKIVAEFSKDLSNRGNVSNVRRALY